MNDFIDLQREALAHELRKHLEGEVRFDQTSRRLYSNDASIYQMEPLGVVIPRSIGDVQITMQILAQMGISITARGGGTSLSGQSIGPGVVLDVSKYLNQIHDLDREGRTVRLQPGVVLDQLNRAVAPFDLQFGPDVATASRANLGGMIGNNSAGARSIVFGKTIDHVRKLKVILADGRIVYFASLSADEWNLDPLSRRCREIVLAQQSEIERRFPKILRRVSGYNLDALCGEKSGLHQLIVGSEGTLGIVVEAELDLVPRPRHRGLLVPQFAKLNDAMLALSVCLEHQPSAVELLDDLLIRLCAGNLSLREAMSSIQGNPKAVLMVEISGEEPGEVAHRIEKLQHRLQEVPGLVSIVPAIEHGIRDPLWNLRRAAMPLLYGIPGDRKPITFVEDCAVSPEKLPEFAARFREILLRHGTDGAFYGHASVGCLHIRPLLNLKDREDVARMRRITGDVVELVLEFGGSLSGEHGDGMVRSEWNQKMFGPTLYQAFRQIKHAFDPQNLLNPGKVVDASPMTENLRYDHYNPPELLPVLDYRKQEGMMRSIEMCNGSGVCRKREGGTMCPSYRATLDEKDSTRGRANILRLALAGDGELVSGQEGKESKLVPRALHDRRVHDVLDLCLMCKACKAECPSNVDMAKLKAEFLEQYYSGRTRPIGHRLMGKIHQINRLSAPFAPFVNWFQNLGVTRWLMEKVAGIDRRRSLPRLHFHHFRRWFSRHQPVEEAGRNGKVLLLDDCFTTWNEPEIGKATVRVLEKAGYEVELANICCGRAMISKGFLRDARALVERQLVGLRQRLASGIPILGMEPSCLLTLVDEWTELVPGTATQSIAQVCHLADGWLAEQIAEQKATLDLKPRSMECIFHGHCHQKALQRAEGSVHALNLIPGMYVDVLDAGCCGMAGSFGFEKEHYDLSVDIANLALLPTLRERPETMVVAPGTSCRHQILDLDGRRALHPMEILAEQLSDAPPSSL